MSEIQRYEAVRHYFDNETFEHKTQGADLKASKRGPAVLFTDHEAVLLQRDERIGALEAKVERLSAPVTDAELTPHLLGKKWPITEAFDALIAARKRAA